MTISGFGKKRAFFALAAGTAVLGGVMLLRHPSVMPKDTTPVAGAAPAVTVDGYHAAAQGAVKGLRAGDAQSVDSTLGSLSALRVPKEGMEAHACMVTSLSAYRAELSAGNENGALTRVRECLRANPWFGISL